MDDDLIPIAQKRLGEWYYSILRLRNEAQTSKCGRKPVGAGLREQGAGREATGIPDRRSLVGRGFGDTTDWRHDCWVASRFP